jgi:succinyl-CoA---D-citramalate CoA-transferase
VRDRSGILSGIKILDLSHQYAGSLAACLLADLGADVVVVEQPEGSPLRTMLPRKSGQSLWWKAMGRGKRAITLRLSTPEGRDLALELIRTSDVVIENFRPGTLERWGLGPADLEASGAAVVLLRISGFGQTGPYRERPGYGTIAEAMSGFAHLNGFPDGPPVFPSTTVADGVAGVFGAYGILAALLGRRRERRGVEVVDVSLVEGLFRLIPTQMLIYDQLGEVVRRPGNFLGSHGVLRNLYTCSDGIYFCVSAIGDAPIRRVLRAVGAAELERRLADTLRGSAEGFGEFLRECDAAVAMWAVGRSYAAAAEVLESADVVFQRVYTVADIATDPHYLARGDLISVPDAELGSILMPAPFPKFPHRDHPVQHAGPALGTHTQEVLTERLGLSPERLAELRGNGTI